ncbi:winged helix-turn-helix domain-containing protein [Kitasatospora sp. NPDC056138]|uniref:winged helix-turn-helix domain-containing protein n=1 Tax=Kitasatospora sp. NPDC056138 TaxID=3345724 RepID=UPI0035DB230F
MWTRAIVCDLISLLYRVRLTEQGVGKYLKRSHVVRGLDAAMPASGRRTSSRRRSR